MAFELKAEFLRHADAGKRIAGRVAAADGEAWDYFVRNARFEGWDANLFNKLPEVVVAFGVCADVCLHG